MTPNRLTPLTAAAVLLLATGAADAGQVYAGAGVPGLMLGYAQPLDARFGVRGDFANLSINNRTLSEEGIDYTVQPTLSRFGLFGDWFMFSGGLRLTGGVTFNRIKLDMNAQGNGGTVTIGGTVYPLAADDRLNVLIEFPKTTPYIGLGWGHHQDTGLGLVFDIGASIGKAKVSATASGTNLGQVSQADLDRELAELRDGVGKVKAFPQLSLGLSYKF